jgi:hypothetical protein
VIIAGLWIAFLVGFLFGAGWGSLITRTRIARKQRGQRADITVALRGRR